jgi:Archaeal holliday junction resolvase (hjc)
MPRLVPTEIEIQKGITDLLAVKGFELIHHEGFSIGSPKGLPDVIAVRPFAIVFIECKGPRGRVAPEQAHWIATAATIPGCLFAAIVGPETTDRWMGYDDALEQMAEIL